MSFVLSVVNFIATWYHKINFHGWENRNKNKSIFLHQLYLKIFEKWKQVPIIYWRTALNRIKFLIMTYVCVNVLFIIFLKNFLTLFYCNLELCNLCKTALPDLFDLCIRIIKFPIFLIFSYVRFLVIMHSISQKRIAIF